VLTPRTVVRCFSFPVYRDIWKSFSTRYFSIWDSIHNPFSPGQTPYTACEKYTKIWNELLDRASSLPADTPAIFANLLGVSAYEVLNRDTNEARMAFIIRQQRVLPLEMLYNTGPRLQQRLNTQTPDVANYLIDSQDASEENIGLVEVSGSSNKTHSNGWVPAGISGDKVLKAVTGQLYLRVFEDCLRIYEGNLEKCPWMYTTTETKIPETAFILDLGCQTGDCDTENTVTVVNRIVNSPTYESSSQEAVLGHCFIYDAGSLLGSSKGFDEQVPGVHLIVHSQSAGRLTTRYSGPIRLTRITKEEQRVAMLPILKTRCTVHGTAELVDIIYGRWFLHLALCSRAVPTSANLITRCRRLRAKGIHPGENSQKSVLGTFVQSNSHFHYTRNLVSLPETIHRYTATTNCSHYVVCNAAKCIFVPVHHRRSGRKTTLPRTTSR
jgi:hypothetical protein